VNKAVLANVKVITDASHAFSPMGSQQIYIAEVNIHQGGSTMYHNQAQGTAYPTQAVTPNAPAIADATAIIIFNTIFHVVFFFSSIFSVFKRLATSH